MVARIGRVAVALVACLAVGLGVRLSLADPPGNNGTVKVDGITFDDHPNNEPHVGCTFQIDFYNYDRGDLEATITFDGIPPTGGGTLLSGTVLIGEDPARGGGDLDASRSYGLATVLAGIEPHAQQGYHVKLTVHADGSQGADVKHKVFWTECQAGPGVQEVERPRAPVPSVAGVAQPVPDQPGFAG